MNQPIAMKQPQHIPHLVPTVLIGIVCLFCLLSAGVGIYASKGAKTDICVMAAQQIYGIGTTVKNDRRLIPNSIKKTTMGVLSSGYGFLAEHCPPESIKPPEPEDTGDPKQILHQLLGAMVQ